MASPEELDDSIKTAYQSYKAATNYFLEWLWCHYRLVAPGHTSSHTFKSGAEILVAVKILRKAKIAAPPSVIASLQQAILKRRVALAIYQSRSTDDVEHEIFLQRLEMSLQILIPMMGASDSLKPGITPETTFIAPNPYSSISILDEDTEPEAVSTNASAPKSSSKKEAIPDGSIVRGRNTYLEDDKITALCEGADFILVIPHRDVHIRLSNSLKAQELHDMHQELQQCWKDAAKGDLPIPVAAWLTSDAFHKIQATIPSDLDETINILVGGSLSGKLYGKGRDSFLENPMFQDADVLFHHHHAMKTIMEEGIDSARFDVLARIYESSTKFGGKSGNETMDKNGKPKLPPQEKWSIGFVSCYVIREIFASLKKDMSGTRAITGVEQITSYLRPRKGSCEPFFAEACEFLKDGHPKPPSTLVIGLRILLSTSEAFFWPDNGALNTTNCRLEALRLAQQMKASVAPVIDRFRDLPVNPDGKVPWLEGARSFYDEMNAYTREKRFDLYHMMPWTAGCHMTEMLYQAKLYGNLLILHNSVVPGTLHLYNTLVQSRVKMHRIPVMDELCEMFLDSMFLGRLPDANFLSHFRRAVHGCKISKDKGVQHDGKLISRLELDPKQGPRLLWVESDFKESHIRNHGPIGRLIARMHGITIPPRGDIKPEVRRRLDCLYYSTPCAEHTKRAKEEIVKEFRGPRPVMAVDYFAIFNLCAEVMCELVRLRKPDMEKEEPDFDMTAFKSDLFLSSKFVDDSIEIIMKLCADKNYRGLVSTAGKDCIPARAFSKLDKKLSLDQMKWKM
ncbi:hypothetical protein CkaCkLH20_07662 [Colletotrichum karsti]|uniref:DUF6604 domain-containing protein n=1 Tax=Colletotrichum karsti TaxID=1095194 RepID=A0A9P6I1Y5_9PEZI|nr:uncharacterized protein CkaCkLH20_07662 [Colletotrichum karsti]KAF9874968.1 hypothetical protein CkaCkLH20_07662 [Colletotrichum karsti]